MERHDIQICDSIAPNTVVLVVVTDVTLAAAVLVDRSACLLLFSCKNERSEDRGRQNYSTIRKARLQEKAVSLATANRFRPSNDQKSMDNAYGEVCHGIYR
jgi:hypothetical protein